VLFTAIRRLEEDLTAQLAKHNWQRMLTCCQLMRRKLQSISCNMSLAAALRPAISMPWMKEHMVGDNATMLIELDLKVCDDDDGKEIVKVTFRLRSPKHEDDESQKAMQNASKPSMPHLQGVIMPPGLPPGVVLVPMMLPGRPSPILVPMRVPSSVPTTAVVPQQEPTPQARAIAPQGEVPDAPKAPVRRAAGGHGAAKLDLSMVVALATACLAAAEGSGISTGLHVSASSLCVRMKYGCNIDWPAYSPFSVCFRFHGPTISSAHGIALPITWCPFLPQSRPQAAGNTSKPNGSSGLERRRQTMKPCCISALLITLA